jgi:N-acetylglucosamine kinase
MRRLVEVCGLFANERLLGDWGTLRPDRAALREHAASGASYVAATDGGGTKVFCLLASADGRVVGAGRGGPINTNFVPEEVARASLREAFAGALAAAGLEPGLFLRCLVHAGPVPLQLVGEEAARFFQLAAGCVWRVGEGEAAMEAMQPWVDLPVAVAVDAGTGSLASGRDGKGRWAHAGGWGALLGDEGSGYWIGLRAMQAAVRASDGREEMTALQGRILSHFGIQQLQELIPLVYRGPLGRREIASLAPVVAQVAREGDAVAQRIMQEAAAELALLAAAVIRRLQLEREEFALVAFGSVFRAYDVLGPPFQARVSQVAPRARVVLCQHEPVVGCLVVALREAGLEIGREERDLIYQMAAQALLPLQAPAATGEGISLPAGGEVEHDAKRSVDG